MITVNQVRKEFEHCVAVDGISFHIPKGEIVGIIGANGSGKTTTLKLLTGLLKPSSGYIRTFGLDPVAQRKKLASKISVLFGKQSRLFEDMPVIHSLELTKYIYHVADEVYQKRFQKLREILNLDSLLNCNVKELSLGERLRADIGCTLIHQPELMIFDEAFLGLDLIVKERIIQYLLWLQREEAVTILLSSHNFADVEKLCSRILLLDHGSLIHYGDMNEMKASFAPIMTVSFEVIDQLPDMQDLPIQKYTIQNKKVTITYNSNLIHSGEIMQLILSQCRIREVTMHEPRMEEILLNMYQKKSGG